MGHPSLGFLGERQGYARPRDVYHVCFVHIFPPSHDEHMPFAEDTLGRCTLSGNIGTWTRPGLLTFRLARWKLKTLSLLSDRLLKPQEFQTGSAPSHWLRANSNSNLLFRLSLVRLAELGKSESTCESPSGLIWSVRLCKSPRQPYRRIRRQKAITTRRLRLLAAGFRWS